MFDTLKFQELIKVNSKNGWVFDELCFPKVDEELTSEDKKRVADINVDEGVYTLRITLRDDKQLKPQRMIKLRTDVEKGQWFISKYVEKRKQPPFTSAILTRTQKWRK